jgi:hypothetical protein
MSELLSDYDSGNDSFLSQNVLQGFEIWAFFDFFDFEKKVGKPNEFEKDFLMNFQGFHRLLFSKIRIN